MRISIFIALVVTVATIYAFIWYPVSSIQFEIAFGVTLLFFLFCWSMWGMQEIKFRRWYKARRRFQWYTKMGMLESGYILEPRHAKLYWRNLMSEFSK